MAASDVTDTLEDALEITGLTEARVHPKPRLLCRRLQVGG